MGASFKSNFFNQLTAISWRLPFSLLRRGTGADLVLAVQQAIDKVLAKMRVYGTSGGGHLRSSIDQAGVEPAAVGKGRYEKYRCFGGFR